MHILPSDTTHAHTQHRHTHKHPLDGCKPSGIHMRADQGPFAQMQPPVTAPDPGGWMIMDKRREKTVNATGFPDTLDP